MNKQDMLKVQTCVLRVNIHCEGCKDKVKKKLQKVQGVYKVSIDVEQGKVFVSGNVDPAVLIEKLEKSGKHAEFLGVQNGQNPANFLNNVRFENPSNGGKDNRSQKGGKVPQKSGHQQNHLQQQNIKGLKDVKFLGKDNKKSGKLNLSEDEDEDDDEDDFDDEFDDDSDEEFVTGHQVSNKVANGGGGGGHLKGKNGAKNGKKGGGGFNFLKGMLGKTGAKDGSGKNGGKIKAERGNQDQVGGKKGGKNGGFVVRDGKSGGKNGKNDGKNNDSWGKNDGKNNDSWSKKGGEKFDVVPKMDNKQQGFKEFNANDKRLNGGNLGMMGNFPAAAQGLHMGNFPGAAQGRPPVDHFGLGHGNPYNQQQQQQLQLQLQQQQQQQQQYMAQMMMMNQQRPNGNDMYHPMMFNRPMHPGMNYGPPPPPANDKFTHIFSDENTDSCSIM